MVSAIGFRVFVILQYIFHPSIITPIKTEISVNVHLTINTKQPKGSNDTFRNISRQNLTALGPGKHRKVKKGDDTWASDKLCLV